MAFRDSYKVSVLYVRNRMVDDDNLRFEECLRKGVRERQF